MGHRFLDSSVVYDILGGMLRIDLNICDTQRVKDRYWHLDYVSWCVDHDEVPSSVLELAHRLW